MNVVFGKKYWLTFAGCYGSLAGIRQIGDGEFRTMQYQFNDETTGTPHFCLQENLETLVSDEQKDADADTVKRIAENSKELEDTRKEYEQMDLFSMMDSDQE